MKYLFNGILFGAMSIAMGILIFKMLYSPNVLMQVLYGLFTFLFSFSAILIVVSLVIESTAQLLKIKSRVQRFGLTGANQMRVIVRRVTGVKV